MTYKMALSVVTNKGNLKHDLVIKTPSILTEHGYGGASGLLILFEKGAAYLGLIMGEDSSLVSRNLKECFQGNNRAVRGFYKSVAYIIDELNALRTNEKFSSVFKG